MTPVSVAPVLSAIVSVTATVPLLGADSEVVDALLAVSATARP